MTREAPRTVFFLSDFGTEDEFAGVVHAVIAARAPGTTVIDLTHHIPAFDVRSGSHALVRAVPFLGEGVVLAVVDPGVGTERRGIALEVTPFGEGPRWFVGPDNGLLIAAAEAAAEAPVGRVVELRRPEAAAGASGGSEDTGPTFDGRDVFGPAAAALCAGASLDELGTPVDAASVVRLVGGVVEAGRLDDGRACLRTEVTWVDHYGNVQLAATAADARIAGIPLTGRVQLAGRGESERPPPDGFPRALVPDGVALECVDAFGRLARGEFGLLVDANGHLAVVAGQASAAHWLNIAAGELLVLAW